MSINARNIRAHKWYVPFKFYRVKGLLNSESDPNAVEYVVEKVVTGLLRREDTDTDRMEQDQPLPIETSYFETGLRENVDKSSSNVCIMSEVKNVPPTERFEPLNAFGTCPAIIAPMQIASPLSALPPISMDIGHRFGTSSPPMLISPSLSPGTARGTPVSKEGASC